MYIDLVPCYRTSILHHNHNNICFFFTLGLSNTNKVLICKRWCSAEPHCKCARVWSTHKGYSPPTSLSLSLPPPPPSLCLSLSLLPSLPQFSTPSYAIPGQLPYLPLTYLTYDVASIDGQSHQVQLYYDNSGEVRKHMYMHVHVHVHESLTSHTPPPPTSDIKFLLILSRTSKIRMPL